MSNNSKQKPWPCPTCGHNLGMVLYGQLLLDKGVQANTDGSNLVLKCPQCGNRKVWYGNDRLTAIEREIAQFVFDRIQNEMSQPNFGMFGELVEKIMSRNRSYSATSKS